MALTDRVGNVMRILTDLLQNMCTDPVFLQEGSRTACRFNIEAEVVNPLAAEMARELADDPITAEAARLREQGAAEKTNEEESGTILDEADDQLPDFLKADNTALGVNMQNFDQDTPEESSENSEESTEN